MAKDYSGVAKGGKKMERRPKTGERTSLPQKKERHPRSNPKIEYVLDDAQAEERTLIKEGTITDRVNCLALLCARNPSVENYKQFLCFAERQRNDVIFLVLKNLKDLLKEKPVEDLYIKRRALKSFEMGMKNQYIKCKVLDLVGVLLRAGVYAEELVGLVVERIIEKDAALTLVETVLRSVFTRHEEWIVAGLEDMYYKGDSFRVQQAVLRFLSGVEFGDRAAAFAFYNQALTTLDEEYPAEQQSLLLELIVGGLGRTADEGAVIERMDRVYAFIGAPKTVVAVLRLLRILKDPQFDSFVLRAAKSLVLRGSKQEPEFLNILSESSSKEVVAKLVNTSFYFSPEYIIALIFVAREKAVDPSHLFALPMLSRHYHPAVREVASKTLRGEEVSIYDPYDHVVLSAASRMIF